MVAHVDITPSPRILRTLGEIPFQPWQCLAELIDNSLDGFSRSAQVENLNGKRIIASWSSDDVSDSNKAVELSDTGPGMALDLLQNCVKAGYSSNDPLHNLGLFGMGFNIATARLGEKTVVWSATKEASQWVGIEIDFVKLASSKSFEAPVLHRPKSHPNECGTKVIVSKLKPNVIAFFRNGNQVTQMRKILADVYSPILMTNDVEIRVQSHVLSPRRHCIWSSGRYVSRQGETTPAIIEIDKVLGTSLFNISKQRYLSVDEEAEARAARDEAGQYPEEIVERERRVRGWLGIQRYFDTDDFGIDFIRNGRKILLRSKNLFSYHNPLTETDFIEYPVELGTTVGGRIVGEIHVDHIPPTYQKNDFDRADKSWVEMIEVIRGVGPMLPLKRKTFGFSDNNTSPLSRLVNSYRRTEDGTRNLSAPKDAAKSWAESFRKGEAEYQSDEKWWAGALEADRLTADKGSSKAPPVDPGQQSSDDMGLFGPTSSSPNNTQLPSKLSTGKTSVNPQQAKSEEQIISELKEKSSLLAQHSKEYGFEGCFSPIKVNVWELKGGNISEESSHPPVRFYSNANECDFIFNPKHSFFQSFRMAFKDFLFVLLAEKFRVRDNRSDIEAIFSRLVQKHYQEARIDQEKIVETALVFFERLKAGAVLTLTLREQEALDLVHQSSGEVEEIAKQLMQHPELFSRFQARDPGTLEVIQYFPPSTLIRLVDTFPEEFFDSKVFKTPYKTISLQDTNATQRLRADFKDRILSYMKDAARIVASPKLSSSPDEKKEELSRCAHSINLLMRSLVD